jgi:membrane protein implicated in regulation of membrane protease activity
MWEKPPLFLDYLQVRHRIESRLAASQTILGHIALFLIVVIALLISAAYTGVYPYVPRSHFIDVGISYLMTVWSIALLGHGLWVYRKSGASANVRTRIIENELNQRLEHGDTELLDDPRQGFRLQALLNEDVRMRAGLLLPVMIFLMINAANWAAWAVQGAYSSWTWQLTVPAALVLLLPPLAVNAWRRRRRNRRIMQLLGDDQTYAAAMKPKRTIDDEDGAAYRLSDDGEFVPISEDTDPLAARKAKA